jgi:hypothetical protein
VAPIVTWVLFGAGKEVATGRLGGHSHPCVGSHFLLRWFSLHVCGFVATGVIISSKKESKSFRKYSRLATPYSNQNNPTSPSSTQSTNPATQATAPKTAGTPITGTATFPAALDPVVWAAELAALLVASADLLVAAPESPASLVVIAPTLVAMAVALTTVPLGRQIPPWSMSLLSKAPTSPGRQQKYTSER